jgi:hypothetical protein
MLTIPLQLSSDAPNDRANQLLGEKKVETKLKLIYDRQLVGQSVLVPGTHLEPATNFSFFLIFSLDSCGFVIL